MQTEGRAARRGVWPIVDRILRPASAALAAGLVAGAVASGASRIAMRIAALAADPCIGVVTENGNECGVFTFGGTAGLIIFSAIFTGVPGAILYAAFSTWLRPLGRWRGVAFGIVSLGTAGFVVLDPNNVDFTRFGSPVTNVATFALLFIIFGLVVAPVFEAVERRLPTLPPRRPVRLGALVGYAFMAFTVIPIVAISIASLGLGLLILALLAVIHEIGDAIVRARERRPSIYAAFAIPIAIAIAGTWLTAKSIADILG